MDFLEFLKVWLVFSVVFAILLIPFIGIDFIIKLGAASAILGIFATLIYQKRL